MTALEVVMKRDDPNIAWGFRLTGGADLGTPFYVVKVLGRGHAERAGVRVGDMVYAINHKYVNTYTHKDAQNAILHSSDTLILNIRRGPFSGRTTPLPDYVDPLMGLMPPPPVEIPKPVPPPPYEIPPYKPPPPIPPFISATKMLPASSMIKPPTPPESEDEEEPEETVASFTIKMNPKGRIAAIEELPVTPPPSRSTSRCRSRSRSVSRDVNRSRKTSAKQVTAHHSQQNNIEHQNNVEEGFVPGPGGTAGPGEAFTYSKEVVTQYSTVLSAAQQSEGQTSEMVNESFIIHGGSQHKMEDILSPEDIERDIFEEKMEEQKITELLTGEAELLDQGVVGINFQKIIPKTEFIKDSEVFKELQDQIIKKEEPEEVQLQKDPYKRFSTFLQTPKRPVTHPKPKTVPSPQTLIQNLPWNQLPSQQVLQQTQILHQEEKIVSESTMHSRSFETIEQTQIHEVMTATKEDEAFQERTVTGEQQEESGLTITEVDSQEDTLNEQVCDEKVDENEENGFNEERREQEKCDEAVINSVQTNQEVPNKTEPKSEFERQLDEIRKQMEAIQQLPSVLLANLSALQEQLNKIVEAKVAADQKEIEASADENKNEFEETVATEDAVNTVVEESENCVIEESTTFGVEETTEYSEHQELEPEDHEVAQTIQNGFDENYENLKNQVLNELHQKQRDENPSVAKPGLIRKFPHNVAERPIVLPGGRKWYKPKDAYNEDFIAETIIHQSEVLVGTTIGMNFCKYEPPKFDAANSAVYRLIREIEGRKNEDPRMPIEQRPEKILAEEDYFPPINKRHFFAARLTEQIEVPETIDKVLQDTEEGSAITV